VKNDISFRVEIFLSSIFDPIKDSDEQVRNEKVSDEQDDIAQHSISQHIVYLISLADADLKHSFSEEIEALENHILSSNVEKITTNESITNIYNKLKKISY